MRALDIIKAMPIDEKLKLQIINRYDFLAPSQKLAVDYLAWTTFYDLYEETLNDNLGVQYQNVKKGTDNFGGDFYKRALEKTDHQMINELQESLTNANLSIARKAIEQIMNEIHASKKQKHHKTD
jgi:hypothetical protein